MSGGEADTTNNRMELTAVISALQALKEPCRIKIYSDSQYVCNGINKGWAEGWKKRGWKKSDKSPALNPDLWDTLLNELQRHDAELIWVKGHAGHPENERCDRLAVAAADFLNFFLENMRLPLAKYTKSVYIITCNQNIS